MSGRVEEIRIVGQPLFTGPIAEPYPREYTTMRCSVSRHDYFELRMPAKMTADEIRIMCAFIDLFAKARLAGAASERRLDTAGEPGEGTLRAGGKP